MNDQDRISALEAEVKRLKIKLETLVAFLNLGLKLGPPDGRELHDLMVKEALEKQGL
jgi:hypothetical protein